jgi:tetratricopeptide (TPR) repeat protein
MQDQKKAEQRLRKLRELEGSEDAKWARDVLAGLLAARGDAESADEALRLVGLDPNFNPIDQGAVDRPEDLRLRAVVLTRQKGRKPRLWPSQLKAAQVKAAQLLEAFSAFQPLSADDQFLLAQLYQAQGDWKKERAVRLALLASHPTNTSFTSTCALRLLQNKEIGTADACLKHLPQGASTLELKVRILLAQRQNAEAIALLKTYKAASPEDTLLLAKYWGQCGRVDEALTLCERARANCPPDKVSACAMAILYEAKKATDEQFRRVESWIKQENEKSPRSPVFLDLLAALSNLKGDYKVAIDYYRMVQHPYAMNNLAWLLALTGENKGQARELIEEAIRISGPEPSLLDTRGVVNLSLGNPSKALVDLQEATVEGPSASKYFHLARAYLELKDRIAAQDAWNKAVGAGLTRESLHALERSTYDRISGEMTLQ